MEIIQTIKKKSEPIIWVYHIALALYIFYDGVVAGTVINKWFAIAVVGFSLYLFHLLRKDLMVEKTRKPEIVYKDKPKKERQPFSLFEE